MRLLIRMSMCTHGLHLSKPPQHRMLWLEHRLIVSPALRRKRPSTGAKTSASAFLLSSPRPFMSVFPCSRLPLLCSPTHSVRTVTHTPVAFASSSAASTPSPSGSLKTKTDTEEDHTPTSVPLEDVKRILRLAHPERWRLAGKQLPVTLHHHTTLSMIYVGSSIPHFQYIISLSRKEEEGSVS